MRSEFYRHVAASRCLQFARDVDHAGANARTDVESARIHSALLRQWLGCRQKNRAGYVTDVDVVARLQPVTENRQRSVVENAAAENRDDTGLAVRVLAWSVDVAESHGDRFLPMHASVVREIKLDAQLRDRVRRFRILRIGLEIRRRIEIAIEHSA